MENITYASSIERGITMNTLLDFMTEGNAVEVFSVAEKLELLNACNNIGLCWAGGGKANHFIPQGDHMYFVVTEGDLYWGSMPGHTIDRFRLHDWKTICPDKTPAVYLFVY